MKDLIAASKVEKTLLKYLDPIFLDTEYEIIRIKVKKNNNKIVQIMIDHSYKIIDIEDCATYSGIISNFLDKEVIPTIDAKNNFNINEFKNIFLKRFKNTFIEDRLLRIL